MKRRTCWISLTVVSIAALTSGCSSGTHPQSDAGRGNTTELTAMTPRASSDVEKVTWNVFEGEPQTVSPYQSYDYSPNMINSNMCENVLAQTPDAGIQPNLAESYDNPDPLHWVYRLRSDVSFWDGAPMTAEDVAYSLDRHRTDPTSFYHSGYVNVKSVRATGPHEVTVTLSKPDYLFNEQLASFAGAVVEKKFAVANGKRFGSPKVGVMCTGPYKFAKWVAGQSITVERNPEYWNKKLQPRVGTIEFTFVTDNTSITAGLLSGEIDGTYNVPTTAIQQLDASSAGKLYRGPAPLFSTVQYANPRGAMSNLKMRQALQMAIDWEGIAKSVYHGAATPRPLPLPTFNYGEAKPQLEELTKSLPAPPSARYSDAKKLLGEVPANVRRQRIVFAVPSTVDAREFGIAVEDAARRIGMNLKLKVVPSQVYISYFDPKARAGIDMMFTEFWSGVPSAANWMSLSAVTGGQGNLIGYTGIDGLYAQAQGTRDKGARSELIAQMQAKLRKELLPMAPGLQVDNTMWLNKRITGAPASFSYTYYPWAALLGGTE